MEQAAQVALANRILHDRGIVDAFGHPSVRSADGQGFLISRNLAPASVTPADVQRMNLDATTDDPRPAYLERFIHAAIYRARPDVGAVIHHHSPAVLPFSVSSRRLVPVTHMAGFLGDGAPVFEIRDVVGSESDLMIGSNELAAALAGVLGDSAVVLMRGHGATVVGATIEQAVHRAVYTEYNARALASAVALGGQPTCLTRAEAEAADLATSTQAHRAWSYWSAQVHDDLAETGELQWPPSVSEATAPR